MLFSTPTPAVTEQPRTLAAEATAVIDGALDRVFLGNTLAQWITFGAILVASFLVAWLIRTVLISRLKKWAERTTTHVDDLIVTLIADVRLWLIGPALLTFAARGLTLQPSVDRLIHLAAMAGLVVQLVLSSRVLIDFGLKALANKHRGADGLPDPTLVSSLGVLRVIGLMVVATLAVLMALENLGIEIKPLLAGLGIGGIAVALAVQNLLSDLFGSLTILLDKPFVVGDFITVGDKAGTIERIGIKTTRVRALSGEQLVFANSDLLTSRLHNYKRMQERRVVFAVSVTYETPPALLHQIPGTIRRVIESQPQTRFDRSNLKSLASYSLDYETVYFVKTADYNQYMNVQEAINLALIEEFAKLKVEFAYPTQLEYHRETALPEPKPAGPKS